MFVKVGAIGYGNTELCFHKITCDFNKTEGENIDI